MVGVITGKDGRIMKIERWTKKRNIRICLTICMLLLPVAALFTCIFCYGVNVVFWDEWSVVSLYDDLASNGISFSKLYAQHNEHRMFFSKILMLLSHCMTKWNTKYLMYISAGFLSVTYYLCIKCAVGKKRIVDFTGKDVLFCVLSGLCLMSVCQWENLLWGFQVAWFLIELCVTASLAFFCKYLQKGNKIYCLASILFATISTYSSLQGLAVWPMYACLFLILSLSERKWISWKKWLPYAAVGILEIGFYFYDYTDVSYHEAYRADGMKQCFDFMMAQLGLVFCDSNELVAGCFGRLLTLLAFFCIIRQICRKKAEKDLLPIGMIIFAMGVLLMISIGRSNLSMTSRYTTYALMAVAGVLFMIYRDVNGHMDLTSLHHQDLRQILIAAEGMLLALCLMESMDSLEKCGDLYQSRKEVQKVMQNYKDETLESLHRTCAWETYEDAYRLIGVLSEKKWSVWEHGPTLYRIVDTNDFEISEEALQTYNIEKLGWDDSFKILSITGWAVDEQSEKEYRDVYVKINDTVFESEDHQERVDVAGHFDHSAYVRSGFSFFKSTDVLHEGVNEISLLLAAADGQKVYASANTYIYYTKEQEIYRCDENGNKVP